MDPIFRARYKGGEGPPMCRPEEGGTQWAGAGLVKSTTKHTAQNAFITK